MLAIVFRFETFAASGRHLNNKLKLQTLRIAQRLGSVCTLSRVQQNQPATKVAPLVIDLEWSQAQRQCDPGSRLFIAYFCSNFGNT